MGFRKFRKGFIIKFPKYVRLAVRENSFLPRRHALHIMFGHLLDVEGSSQIIFLTQNLEGIFWFI